MDIDHFKQFNDKYGHLAGDIILKKVAEKLKGQAQRATDALARWGGEEFAAILPATNLSGARVVAEKCRSSIERTSFVLDDNTHVSVTISIGLHSVLPQNNRVMTLEKFVAAADSALYHAKQSGRNKVCAADDL